MLEKDPPPGVSVWPKESKLTELEAGECAPRADPRLEPSHPSERVASGMLRVEAFPSFPISLPNATPRATVLEGPEGSPYESGFFKLDISLSSRYPFEPPKVRPVSRSIGAFAWRGSPALPPRGAPLGAALAQVTFRTAIYHPNIDAGGRICLDTLNMPPKGAWKPSVNIGNAHTLRPSPCCAACVAAHEPSAHRHPPRSSFCPRAPARLCRHGAHVSAAAALRAERRRPAHGRHRRADAHQPAELPARGRGAHAAARTARRGRRLAARPGGGRVGALGTERRGSRRCCGRARARGKAAARRAAGG